MLLQRERERKRDVGERVRFHGFLDDKGDREGQRCSRSWIYKAMKVKTIRTYSLETECEPSY